MLASMTGFGRAIVDSSLGRVIAEIQSVNRKYLDISVSLPKEFSRFEQDVRTWVSEKVARGQVSIRIYLIPKASFNFLPDLNVLRDLKRGWETLAKDLGYDPMQVDLPFLLQRFPVEEKMQFAEESDLHFIEQCLKEALHELIEMKLKEGKALVADIKKRLGQMESALTEIESLAPDAVQRMKKNLTEKVRELEASPELDDRLAREVLIYADRVDISEEIVRLKSHFNQFSEMLHLKNQPVGRKMDFMLQEIAREINTIGSKSPDAKIAHLVISMKSELEKIREQIQNIE